MPYCPCPCPCPALPCAALRCPALPRPAQSCPVLASRIGMTVGNAAIVMANSNSNCNGTADIFRIMHLSIDAFQLALCEVGRFNFYIPLNHRISFSSSHRIAPHRISSLRVPSNPSSLTNKCTVGRENAKPVVLFQEGHLYLSYWQGKCQMICHMGFVSSLTLKNLVSYCFLCCVRVCMTAVVR
jgi:hypothetical protein